MTVQRRTKLVDSIPAKLRKRRRLMISGLFPRFSFVSSKSHERGTFCTSIRTCKSTTCSCQKAGSLLVFQDSHFREYRCCVIAPAPYPTKNQHLRACFSDA